jgi:hypothetical protein
MKIHYCALLLFFFFWQNHLSAQNLPTYTITAYDTSSAGFYFLVPMKIGPGSGAFPPTHLILDKTGAVVYYKKFPTQNTSDFKLHANGLMSYSRQNKFYLMDSTFKIVDSVLTKNGVLFDNHDLQIMPNGHFLILGYENVNMNLSSYNYFNNNGSPGSSNATVKCGVIQEQDAAKNVVFEWRCRNYYNFSDVDPSWLSSPANVDWTHLNAVEYDLDGNLMLSLRHFNEITKIRRSDSSIVWRLGGNQNQFNFLNDPQKFRGQHDIRRLANGNVSLFDNGRSAMPVLPATSKEYQLNETTLTANLVWSYAENANTYSSAMGNTQRLANDNTLTNYGMLNNRNMVFNVVKPTKTKVFEITFKDTLRSYRAFNYLSLPWQLNRPVISCNFVGSQAILDAGAGHASYLWSNGANTQTIAVSVSGTYSVFVPKGQGGFIASQGYDLNMSNPCVLSAIKEQSEEKDLLIYPNPVEDILNIACNAAIAQVKVYDVFGKIHYSCAIAEASAQINLSHLQPGLYFVKINSQVRKIFKN